MPRPWQIRVATRADRPALALLFERVFGRTRDPETDDWRFWSGPNGEGVVVVAEVGDRLVGQYALQPTGLRLGKERILGAQSLDTMTDPDFRGQGMFTVLAIECMEAARARGIEALYGFPNANSYPGFVRRLNWHHAGDIPQWTRPLRGDAWGMVPRAARPLVGMLAALLPSGGGSAPGDTVDEHPPTQAELEALFATLPAPADSCGVDWNPDWTAWRVDARAHREYTWSVVRRNGAIRAAAVTGRADRTSGTLAALLGEDPGALAGALGHAIDQSRRAGLARIRTITNAPAAVAALKRAGFLKLGNNPFIVRSMTGRNLGGNIHHFSSWRILPGDVDTL